MNGTNNISARDSYERARSMFFIALRDKFAEGPAGEQKCKEWVNSLKLTQGEIRLEVQLNATNNIFNFGVTPNQANSTNVVFNTERRLPLQDSICVTEIQLFVMRPGNLVDGVFTASQTGLSQLLRTYGNTFDFTAGAANALDSTFYSHGNLYLKVNGDEKIVYRGLSNFWYKPQTQQTLALGAGAPGDQILPAECAATTCEPNSVITGSSNTVPQIQLPGNLTVVDSFTRAVLVFKGPYAQNSTVVN